MKVQEFGEYSFLVSSIVVLGILVNFGLDGIIQRYVAEFLVRKKYGKVNKIIIFSLFLRFILLIALSLILFVSYPFLKNTFALTLGTSSFIFFLIIFFIDRIKSLLGPALLAAYLEIYKEKINSIIYQIFKLITFSYVVMSGFGIRELLIAWLGVELLSISHFVIISWKKLKKKENKIILEPFQKSEIERMVKYGKNHAIGIALFIFMDIAVDNIMIGFYLNQEAVAFYAFAMSILLIVTKMNPLSILKSTFGAILTRLYIKKKSLKLIKFYYVIITKLNFIVTFPLCAIFLVNLENIIKIIYSENYIETISLVNLGIFFMLINSNNFSFNPLMEALEKNKIFFYAGIFSIFNLVGNLTLIPIYGVFGALISTGTAGILMFIFYHYSFKKIFKNDFFPWKSFFHGLLLTFPIIITGKIFNEYIFSIYGLMLIIISQLILYSCCLYCFKIFNIEERAIINKETGIKFFKF